MVEIISVLFCAPGRTNLSVQGRCNSVFMLTHTWQLAEQKLQNMMNYLLIIGIVCVCVCMRMHTYGELQFSGTEKEG